MAQDPASLENLRDIVLPAPIPWLPPAIGWRLVAMALAAAALVASWRAYGRWRANAYRREALCELDAVEAALREGQASAMAAAEVSTILKRAALAAFPREASAGLAGDRWGAFLDRSGRTKDFTEGAGKDLWPLAYGARSSCADMNGVIDVARRWLRRHSAGETATPRC